MLHENHDHIMSNMALFMVLSYFMEQKYGTMRITLIAFIAGVGGNFFRSVPPPELPSCSPAADDRRWNQPLAEDTRVAAIENLIQRPSKGSKRIELYQVRTLRRGISLCCQPGHAEDRLRGRGKTQQHAERDAGGVGVCD